MEHSGLVVNNYSSEKTFSEVSRIFSSEGAEAVGQDLFLLLKGAGNNIGKNELLKRFYTLSLDISRVNPDMLFSILQSSDVLKKIYNENSLILDESISGVEYLSGSSVYIEHFIQEDVIEIIKDIDEDGSLSDYALDPSNVISVLLRVVFVRFKENLLAVDKVYKRKENITSQDFSEAKNKEISILKESYYKSIKRIKKNLFSEDYLNVLDELKKFLDKTKLTSMEDFGSFVYQLKELKAELKNISVSSVSDTEILKLNPERGNYAPDDIKEAELEEDALSKPEELSQAIKEMVSEAVGGLAKKGDLEEILGELEVIAENIKNVKNIQSEHSEVSTVKDESPINENMLERLFQKFSSLKDDISEKLEELEIASGSGTVSVEQQSIDFSSVNESFEKQISDFKVSINEKFEEMEEKLEDVLSKVSTSSSVENHSGYDSGEGLDKIEAALQELRSKIDSQANENKKSEEKIDTVIELLQSLGTDITKEIGISKKIRKDNGYDDE